MKNLIFFALLLKSVSLFSQDSSLHITVIDDDNFMFDLELDFWGEIDKADKFIAMFVMEFEDGSSMSTMCVDERSSKDPEMIEILNDGRFYYRIKQNELICYSNVRNSFINYIEFIDNESGYLHLLIDGKTKSNKFDIISVNKKI